MRAVRAECWTSGGGCGEVVEHIEVYRVEVVDVGGKRFGRLKKDLQN